MQDRSKPWQIAADLEIAAEAVRSAMIALNAIHWTAVDEMEAACPGSEHIDRPMVDALLALSAKYQAIADAEPDDGPECPSSPTRRHQLDTSMESGPHNCFYCERKM